MSEDIVDRIIAKLRNNGHEPNAPAWFVVASLAATLVWLFWASTSRFWAIWAGAVAVGSTDTPASTSAAGAWGDSFGAFNALVGALGFGAIATTLYLQHRSLQQQKIDQHISRFEENLFRLIDLMRSLRDNLKYEQTSNFIAAKSIYVRQGKLGGYDAIEAAYYEVNHWIFKANGNDRKIRKSVVSGKYNSYVHDRYESCFAPYFRIIYTILYNIRHDRMLSDQQKAFYGNILRSQLTSFEIGLMAFNATSAYAKDLTDLINYFRLLKYLPKKRRKVLGDIYPKEAYLPRS